MDDALALLRAPAPAGGLRDHAWRAFYRVGFGAARLWWCLRRPRHDGAIVAVWLDGRVLAVRQSYRRGLTFPGGGIRAGEPAAAAAARELAEELGLAVDPGRLTLARDVVADWDFRRDHVRIFELRLDAPPCLAPDRREILAVAFVDPASLAGTRVPPFVRAYLQECAPGPMMAVRDGRTE